MKRLFEYLELSLAIIVIIFFVGCSPTVEKTPQNDFFPPVDRVVHKKAGSDTLILTRENNRSFVDDGIKDSLMVLFRQQNKQLGVIIQQLNQLTKKSNTADLKETDSLEGISVNQKYISNEMLLENIKSQNQRFNDVIEQLRLLSQAQKNASENHSHLITGDSVTSIQPTATQQVSAPRHPDTSLNYGSALQLYKNRQYKKAIDVFEKLLKQKIEPKLADHYHFWMGVCYININRDDQAINEFTDVLRYTHSNKAEEAYFMIGQCYERAGAKKSAKMTYEKMLRIYPRGNLKKIAEKKLALLK